jgi:hypothetical protein
MPEQPPAAGTDRPDPTRPRRSNSVQVTVADTERRPMPRTLRLAVVALTAVLAAATVLAMVRLVDGRAGAESGPRPAALDARSVTPPATPIQATVPGSTRLALLGPLVLLDSQGTGGMEPGAEATVPLPVLPPDSTAVLLEVSLLAATGPGAVTVGSATAEIPVLRLPAAGTSLTATVVVPVGRDADLRVRTEGGGHLLVNLVGAFEPVETATSGRLVPVPATEVLHLVPDTDGKEATIDLAGVPVLPEDGSVSAVLLHIAADVGGNGGYVAVGGSGELDQQFYWTPTSGDDRTRVGLLVVPLAGGSVDLRYQAGSELTASLVGYVTDGTAPSAVAGLVVPVPPEAVEPVRVPAGEPVDVAVIPPGGIGQVPADRVAAALLGITATGDAAGGVSVHTPGSAAPAAPTLAAAAGGPRATLTLVETVDGEVRVAAEVGASVSLAPQALVLGE